MVQYLLKGLPVCQGLAHGSARLVERWQYGFTIERGDVLVSQFPLRALAPLLRRASALVCGYGDRTASLLVMAREYRIPVVMGIGLGLEHITEGDGLWVEGNAGIVATFNPRSMWQFQEPGPMQPQDAT